jgi:hypothetical protein
VDSVDELLEVLESVSGRVAGLVDVPPLELAGLRRSFAELREDIGSLPTPAELARTLSGLRRTAEREETSLLEASTAVGLAFLVSARKLGRAHVVDAYRDDWAPVVGEGLGTYARRVAVPYRRAISTHFDPARPSLTERALRNAPASGR